MITDNSATVGPTRSTSINQSINTFITRHGSEARATVRNADYAEAKRNVLSRVLNVITDGYLLKCRPIVASGFNIRCAGSVTKLVEPSPWQVSVN